MKQKQKLILTDADGVLFDWITGFNPWMERKGYTRLYGFEQYYTIENLERMGLTVYDILERDLGFPNNWAEGVSSEMILKQIREQEPKPDIDHIFIKYLGHNRFGNIP